MDGHTGFIGKDHAMLGIYANAFMTATRTDRNTTRVHDVPKPEKQQRRALLRNVFSSPRDIDLDKL